MLGIYFLVGCLLVSVTLLYCTHKLCALVGSVGTSAGYVKKSDARVSYSRQAQGIDSVVSDYVPEGEALDLGRGRFNMDVETNYELRSDKKEVCEDLGVVVGELKRVRR